MPGSERRPRHLAALILVLMLGLLTAACSAAGDVQNATGDEGGPNLIGFSDGQLGFPHEVVTTQGNEAAGLYLPVFIIAVAIFILVEGLLLFAALRFRRKPTDTELPTQTHGNNRLELIWTAVPALIVLGMFIASTVVLTRVEAKSDDPGVVVDVQAFRFGWKFDYPDSGVSVAGGGREGAPEMVLPVDEPIRFRVTAVDVIHSFYVPSFFFKRDAIPGRINEFEITIEEPGVYGGQCAEFCGLAHSDMYFSVRAVERPDFEAWLAEQPAAGEAPPAEGSAPPAEGSAPPAEGSAPPAEGGSADGTAPAGQPDRVPGESPTAGSVLTIGVTADQPIAFTAATLEATAGEAVTIDFTNESNVPHNIAVYEGADASGQQLAKSETITGPGARAEITFVPSAGDHFFRCELHPAQMTGILTATP